MDMNSTAKIVGAAAFAAAAAAIALKAAGTRRKGPAAIRLLFAVAVGIGAYWQEQNRRRELAEHLRIAGYIPSSIE